MRRVCPIIAMVVILLASCQKVMVPAEYSGWGEVTLKVAVPGTKVYDTDDYLQTLSILAFTADGKIAARLINAGDTPSFRIPLGETISIWAIANWSGQDLSGIEDEQSLKAVSYGIEEALRFDDEELCWWTLMTAHVEKVFTEASQLCTIALDRALAEVRVESVSLDMNYLTTVIDVPASEVYVDGLYLINCVECMTIGGEVISYGNMSGNFESRWYQEEHPDWEVGASHPEFDSYKLDDYAVDALTLASGGRRTLDTHILYCLPNPAGSEVFDFDDPWTPRPTRVVLSLYTDADGWLEYPVTIKSTSDGVGGLFANTRYTVNYNISGWTGYRFMDRDPDYSFADLYFGGWTEVNLTEKL